jgi:dTDP-4-dehydrorhamnose reductase|tara:strand:+ start:248 stop:1138 length:891 start_codon:yes stop_codon:yes gene_type:complete
LGINKKNILLLGSDGMIGHQVLIGLLKENFLIHAHFKKKKSKQDFLKSKNTIFHFLEISEDNIEEFLVDINPDIIINTAGVTTRREKESTINQIKFTNSLLPNILSNWSEKNGCRLIHFSTDCVFSGEKGNYKDDDKPDALDTYGKTKSLGEVRGTNTLTLRSSMIGFELYNKTELLEWVLSNQNKSINGFSNVIYSGITTSLMSKIVNKIVNDFPDLSGIYNVSSAPISKYSLLKKINAIFDLNIKIKSIESKASNKSLEYSNFFMITGIEIPDWDSMLKELKKAWLLNKHIYED